MSTTQSSYTYEDLKPKTETTDTPESHLLLVHIPDGFTKSDIGAKVEYDFGRVRVFGERSNENNKKSRFRFNEKYQVPSYCDIGNIKGKFDGKIITITMPIIPGAKVPPKQEQEAPQPEPVGQESQPKDQGNDDKEDDKTAAAEVKDQKGDQQDTSDNQDPKSTVESKEDDAHHVTSTQREEQKVNMPQKGQQEISQEAAQASKGEADHATSTTQEQEAAMPQKGPEEISQKDQVTKIENKGEVDHKTSTTPEATKDSMPQNGEEKDTVTKDAKHQTEENTAGLNDENMKKQSKEESKVSVATVESVTTKITEKGKEMMNGKFGDDAEKKSDKKGIPESTRIRIKDMAASTTQAVTNLAKRFSEEDKQKLIYTGAAILVAGLGVYASYKYRSSHKP